MQKLFLLDAYALIYRAYYALIRSPRINSKQQNTSAIFGFVNTLEEILQKEQPTHIAVAFDPKGGTFRHEVYPEYKAQREETPEDIRFSVPIIKDIVRAYNIEIFEEPGFEADDVIGTLALEAGRRGFETYMMTPDKDYGQLVGDNVYIYKPGHGGKPAQKLGVAEICEKYGIKSPQQVIDILGLMGDAVDNVPGCPGVGEKTACTLMQTYDSIEQLYEDPSKLKGKLKEKLLDNKEQVLFSKFLVKIKTDVPLEFDEQKLARKEIDRDRLREIFKDLEFYSFLKKLKLGADGDDGVGAQKSLGSQKSAGSSRKSGGNSNFEKSAAKPAPGTPIQLDLFASDADEIPSAPEFCKEIALESSILNSQIIENEEEGVQKLAQILGTDKFAFQLAGTDLNVRNSKIVGISFCFGENERFFLKISNPLGFGSHDGVGQSKIFDSLKSLFENPKSLKICHDLKQQYQMLRNVGINLKGELFDTMLAHYVLQPELKHGLMQLADSCLGVQLMDIEQVFGPKWKVQQDCSMVDAKMLAAFMEQQVEVVNHLYPILRQQLAEDEVLDFYNQTELPLAMVLGDMETEGVRINTDSLAETSRLFTARMNEYESKAHELSGEKFNISSAKQVGEVLFDRLQLDPKAKKTKTGQYVTSEEVLEALRPTSEVVDNILKYRGMKKLLSTYIDALPALINPSTGHIHSSFNQAVTATGRLSSSNPNLQNIPVRGDDGKEIRKAFIPDEGQLFFSADYSQIELRVMAHLSGDKNMIEAFKDGNDVHAATAAKIYHKDIEEVTSDERRKAKTANFGIIYGISAFGLAQRMDVSRSEAKELIAGYFETYPQIKEYIEQTKEFAKTHGFIETICHRRRYIPDINSHNAVVRGYAERNATNAPIQGSASDIIKMAMVNISRRFIVENLRSKMILQVHDELNFSVLPEEKDRVEQIVKYEMEHACQLTVPLVADCGWGDNWLEAH